MLNEQMKRVCPSVSMAVMNASKFVWAKSARQWKLNRDKSLLIERMLSAANLIKSMIAAVAMKCT